MRNLLQMLLPTARIETCPVFVAFFRLLFFVGGCSRDAGRGGLKAAGTDSEGWREPREARAATAGTAFAWHRIDFGSVPECLAVMVVL